MKVIQKWYWVSMKRLLIGLSGLLFIIVGCSSAAAAPIAPVSPSTNTPPPVPTRIPATPTPSPTPLPASTDAPSATPTITPTPDPFAGWTIGDLAAREYGGPGIEIRQQVLTDTAFARYTMSYQSDGLTITGLVDIPHGEGPFPVIIVNHGYCDPAIYVQGCDSWRVADAIARRGYITVMPDYRNYAGSDSGPNPFRIGYAIDVMNLVPQVSTLPKAAPDQVGVIGHSMGGGATTWPMVLQDEIDAVVLYGAMSGDLAKSWQHIREMWDLEGMDELAEQYGTPQQNPQGYAAASPESYLERVSMPVMLHHGTADTQVPYEWSAALARELEAQGVEVVFHTYTGAPHTFTGETFILFINRTVAFFDQHVRR